MDVSTAGLEKRAFNIGTECTKGYSRLNNTPAYLRLNIATLYYQWNYHLQGEILKLPRVFVHYVMR